MRVIFGVCVLNLFVLDFVHALGENCTVDDDCSDQGETVCCLNKVCTENNLWKYSQGQGKCLKYGTEYGSICYEGEHWQCEFLGNNSICKNNVCICADGYRWYKGKCQAYVNKGEPCSIDAICLDVDNPLALTCTDNVCQCSDGYYDRGEDCRLKSELNKECAISSDCLSTNDIFGVPAYSHCKLGKCVKDTKLSSSLDNFSDATTKSHEEVFVYIANATDDNCANGVLSNLTEANCSSCPNTLYFQNSTCICKQGFYLVDGKCRPELGVEDATVQYTSDLDCPIKPGKLVNGVCYCKNYWFQHSTNRECKKTTLEYTRNCMDNDWCKAMGKYSYCNTDTGKCQCMSQAVLNETSFYCNLKQDANLTGICMSDSDCPLYETCVNEQCQCTEGFYKVNNSGLCLPKIGQSCEVRSCSHIENAACSISETCECESSDYVTNGFLCLKPTKKVNEPCQISEQCAGLKHTACQNDSANTKKCLCTSDYLQVDGTCYGRKSPGSLCSTQKDCTIMLGDTFVCRNMLCQCPIGVSLNHDNVCVTGLAQRYYLSIILSVLMGLLLILS